MIEKEILIKLPMPPSMNVAYINTGKGRKKSEVYENYIEAVDYEFIKMEDNFKIIGDKWLYVKYIFHFNLLTQEGKKKVKDTFNFEKVLTDVLTKKIPGFKDHKIKEGYVRKDQSDKEFVLITIGELD